MMKLENCMSVEKFSATFTRTRVTTVYKGLLVYDRQSIFTITLALIQLQRRLYYNLVAMLSSYSLKFFIRKQHRAYEHEVGQKYL